MGYTQKSQPITWTNLSSSSRHLTLYIFLHHVHKSPLWPTRSWLPAGSNPKLHWHLHVVISTFPSLHTFSAPYESHPSCSRTSTCSTGRTVNPTASRWRHMSSALWLGSSPVVREAASPGGAQLSMPTIRWFHLSDCVTCVIREVSRFFFLCFSIWHWIDAHLSVRTCWRISSEWLKRVHGRLSAGWAAAGC